jgi:hypothetical protein
MEKMRFLKNKKAALFGLATTGKDCPFKFFIDIGPVTPQYFKQLRDVFLGI